MGKSPELEFVDPDPSQLPPEVTVELVHEVERLLGVKLPDAYVSLMKRHNGGYIPEHLVKVEGAVPPAFEGYLDDGYVSVGSIYGIGLDPDRELSIARSPYLVDEWDLPTALVLLDGDGHTWIALDYRKAETNPPVIYLISEGSHHLNIASDFEDFMARLLPYASVYDPEGQLLAFRDRRELPS